MSLVLSTKPRTYLFPSEPQRNKYSVVVARAACGRCLRRPGLPAITSLLTLIMDMSQDQQKTKKQTGDGSRRPMTFYCDEPRVLYQAVHCIEKIST